MATRLRALLDIGYPAALEQGVFQLGFYLPNVDWQRLRHRSIHDLQHGGQYSSCLQYLGLRLFGAGSTLVGQHLAPEILRPPVAAAGVRCGLRWSQWARWVY